MRIFGGDFISRPGPRKPIVVAAGWLRGGRLVIESLDALADLASFERWLAMPGPWTGGFDFPFGMPRRFVEVPR
jgi:hypothetical protein